MATSTVKDAWWPHPATGRQSSFDDPYSRNATVGANKNLIFDKSALSTTEILLIACGTSILITTIVILGVLAVCKWRRKTSTGMHLRSKANGHDRIINGGIRQPLFGSKKYQNRPEIVITEATSDDGRRSSGQVSLMEIHPSKIVTPVPPCTLAILEDLDESELISPAVLENNVNSTVNFHYTRADQNPALHSRRGVAVAAVDRSITSSTDNRTDQQRGDVDPEEWSSRLNRTQSVSSTSSYKNERPSYSYSGGSPHGMQAYGIGDEVAVSCHMTDECSGPLLYTNANQIHTLNTATVEGRQ